MSQFSLIDALQFGGASATIMGVMFLAYKAVTLIVNHRCRSDCCGRWFTLGIQWVEVTPPQHRLSTLDQAMLDRHLLEAFQPTETAENSQSVSSVISPALAPAKSRSAIKNKSQQTVVEAGTSSPAPNHQSNALPIAP